MTHSIQSFVEKYSKQTFKYSERIFDEINHGKLKLLSASNSKNRLTGQQFIEIYGKKAKQLIKKEDTYSKELQDDLIDLCQNLNPYQDEIVDVWTLYNEQQQYFSIFISRNNHELIAVVKTED